MHARWSADSRVFDVVEMRARTKWNGDKRGLRSWQQLMECDSEFCMPYRLTLLLSKEEAKRVRSAAQTHSKCCKGSKVYEHCMSSMALHAVYGAVDWWAWLEESLTTRCVLKWSKQIAITCPNDWISSFCNYMSNLHPPEKMCTVKDATTANIPQAALAAKLNSNYIEQGKTNLFGQASNCCHIGRSSTILCPCRNPHGGGAAQELSTAYGS